MHGIYHDSRYGGGDTSCRSCLITLHEEEREKHPGSAIACRKGNGFGQGENAHLNRLVVARHHDINGGVIGLCNAQLLQTEMRPLALIPYQEIGDERTAKDDE